MKFGELAKTQDSFEKTSTNQSASLKYKLLTLEESVKVVADELEGYQRQVKVLHSEKDTLERVLNMKAKEAHTSLMNEVSKVESELKRHTEYQRTENSRLQQQITMLMGEKTALQQKMAALQRRFAELEQLVGIE